MGNVVNAVIAATANVARTFTYSRSTIRECTTLVQSRANGIVVANGLYLNYLWLRKVEIWVKMMGLL